MHQLVELLEQPGLLGGQGVVTASGLAQTGRRLDGRGSRRGLNHGVAAHSRRLGHRRLAAPAQHLRGRSRRHPALHFVEVRQGHFEESRERLRRDLHTVTVLRAFELGMDPKPH